MSIELGFRLHLCHYGWATFTGIDVQDMEVVYVVTTDAGDVLTLTAAYIKKVLA